MKNLVTCAEVRSRFHYDPESGIFTRLTVTAPFSSAAIGSIAGFRHSSGYWKIKIRCRQYNAHRLAWLYVTGAWPDGEIDHIDMDGSNNCWCNLRVASRSENQRNVGIRKNNSSGFKGVHWDKDASRWRATIMVSGKQRSLGYHDDAEAAGKAYALAALAIHGQFARVQ